MKKSELKSAEEILVEAHEKWKEQRKKATMAIPITSKILREEIYQEAMKSYAAQAVRYARLNPEKNIDEIISDLK